MIRTRLSAWVLAAGALAAATCVATSSLAQAPLREGAAAVVNDEIISTYDLKQRMAMIVGRAGIKLTKDNEPEVQQEALYSLIDERLKLQELHHQEVERKAHGKIIIGDEEVEQEVESIAKSNKISTQQYYAVLASWGVEPE